MVRLGSTNWAAGRQLTNESTIGDTESSSDLGREINVTRGVDQVDQEVVADGLLSLDVLGVLRLGEGGVQGDGSRLDSDTTCLGSAHLSVDGTGTPK